MGAPTLTIQGTPSGHFHDAGRHRRGDVSRWFEGAAEPRLASFYIQDSGAGSVIQNFELRYAGMTAPGNNDFRPGMETERANITLKTRLRDTASICTRRHAHAGEH
jgi:hypothetical protein